MNMRKTSTLLAAAAAMLAARAPMFGNDVNVIDLAYAPGGPKLSPTFKRGKRNPPGTKLARKAAKGRISTATIR